MAGIAGILKEGQHDVVSRMIDLLSHRGNYGNTIIEKDGATIRIGWSSHEASTSGLVSSLTAGFGSGLASDLASSLAEGLGSDLGSSF